jgi:hypothetical protein
MNRLFLKYSTLIFFVVIFSVDLTAQAASSVSSFGRNQPVVDQDYQPHLFSEEYYTESWSHGIWTADGKFMIGLDFAISNFGAGDHKGVVRAEYVDPLGKRTSCKKEYDDDDWSYKKDRFQLDFGANQLKKTGQVIKAKFACKKMKIELSFENLPGAVKPGSGKISYGGGGGKSDGVYAMMFPIPRATVTGQVILSGQSPIEVKGLGYADHSYSNVAPHEQTHRWFRFKSIKKDLSIIMAETEAPTKYSSGRNGWILIYDDQGKIMATSRARFDFDGFIKDKKSEEKYMIPRRVRIAAIDGQTHLTGTLLMKDISKIKDPTAKLGSISRAIVRRFTKPRDYYINCSYKFRIKSKDKDVTIEDVGTYRFMYVNPK